MKRFTTKVHGKEGCSSFGMAKVLDRKKPGVEYRLAHVVEELH